MGRNVHRRPKRTYFYRDTNTIPTDKKRRHCKICGFYCKKDRDAHSDGDGISYVTATVSGAISIGDTTVTVDSTSGFDSADTVNLFSANGDVNCDFTYTGTTSTTFTGVTGITKAFPDASVVVSSVTYGGCPFCGSLNWL